MNSEHHAEVVWQAEPADDFLRHRYSRRHLLRFADGAVQVPGSASPQVVPAPWSDAQAVDPEAAFVAALSACHMLWFLDLAARAGWTVRAYRDAAAGLLAPDADGRLAITTVTLRPAAVFGGAQPPDAAEIARLHRQAHDACFLARSVRSEVRCEPVTDLDGPPPPDDAKRHPDR